MGLRDGLGFVDKNTTVGFRGAAHDTAIIKFKADAGLKRRVAIKYFSNTDWASWSMTDPDEIDYLRENGFFPIPYQPNVNMR